MIDKQTQECEKAILESWRAYASAFEIKGNVPNEAFRWVFTRAYSLGKKASDAESEEVLMVSRKEAQGLFRACNGHKHGCLINGDSTDYFDGEINVLTILFGSKCLPDEKENVKDYPPYLDYPRSNSTEPNPANDNMEDEEYRNLSQETANCDKWSDNRNLNKELYDALCTLESASVAVRKALIKFSNENEQ